MSVKKLRRFTKVLLITLNIIVALSLILGCYGSYFDPRKYWFTGFFTLASFYFLLMLIGFILFWLFVKRAMVFIGIIAIALSWNPLQEVAPIRESPDFNIKKDPSAIRLMSWNVEHFDILEHKSHPERKQEMIATINEQQPDVACFQEMVASDQFSSAINYLPEFMTRLAMYDYHYTFNPKLDFDSKHHFGIIIFSKYPIINKQTVAYPPKDYNSTFQFADIVKNDDTFRVFNIHLQSLKFSNENRKYIEDPSIKDERDLKNLKVWLQSLKPVF